MKSLRQSTPIPPCLFPLLFLYFPLPLLTHSLFLFFHLSLFSIPSDKMSETYQPVLKTWINSDMPEDTNTFIFCSVVVFIGYLHSRSSDLESEIEKTQVEDGRRNSISKVLF